jgi:GT2 family glycosyltransferase
MLDLSIIIVNYKTPSITVDCIESIYQQNSTLNFEIIVVDNDSQDNSEAFVTEKFSEVIWINNHSNEGFGRANNLGIKKSKGEFILLLNSDTIIIDNAIENALSRLKSDCDNTGIITCQLLNKDGSLQKSFYTKNASYKEILSYNLFYDYFLRSSKKNDSNDIMAIHGAFMMFEKEKIEKVGYFDQDFFMYAEEFEWCYRLLKNGLKLKIYDDIFIYHLEEGSSINKDWNIKQRYLSGALLFKKTHGSLGLLLYLSLHFINLVTNSILMWKLDKKYRNEFVKSQKFFWILCGEYFRIFNNRFNKPLKYRN